MEERRKHKRLDLEVMVELERLDEESVTTLKYCLLYTSPSPRDCS